ncbi:MAG: XdhC family protein [Woeseiaceae bacterium]|nr:XdhC family protein [Woeseiaceae bacterium]
MTITKLLEFFDRHRERGDPLVLVTVLETRGSTYSKAGAQMLINADGVFRGMLSGGCLEGDLAVRAGVVIESGRAAVVEYDLGADDELWGLGVGCDGLIRVQLEPLRPDDGYAPFAAVADILRGHQACDVVLAVADDAGSELVVRVVPPPRLLVLGGGLDAEPVVRIAAELGWRVTVCDHRPAYLEAGDFDAAEAVLCRPAGELADAVVVDEYDAAIVMSHHLASDRSYLAALAESSVRYIGLLGPPARRDRLLRELGAAADRLEDRVYGPAGLDIGGRGPGPIALSILAEVQQVLAEEPAR